MQVSEKVIEFLRLPGVQDIMDIGDFEKLYNIMQETPNIKDSSAISTITQLLRLSGINPLDRMVAIPPYYLHNTNITTFDVPEHIQVIRSRAFLQCQKLTKVNISEGVELILAEAFSFCSQLRDVSLPKSLKFIGGGAFYLCGNLKHIHYSGTSQDWNSIDISENAFFGIGGIILHCKDGDIRI